jgi:hypothetical protein
VTKFPDRRYLQQKNVQQHQPHQIRKALLVVYLVQVAVEVRPHHQEDQVVVDAGKEHD